MTNHPNRSKQQQAKHTPGPWEFGEIKVKGMTKGVMIKPLVGVFDGFTRTNHQFEANARLIAAAPELLAALKACQAAIRDHRLQIGDRVRLPNDTINHASYALKIGDEAVAKAEGR